MMNIEYEDRKCSCCGLVYDDSPLIQKANKEARQFFICTLCAENVYEYVSKLKKLNKWVGVK